MTYIKFIIYKPTLGHLEQNMSIKNIKDIFLGYIDSCYFTCHLNFKPRLNTK